MNPTKKNTRFKLDADDREVIKKIEILTQAVERVYPNTKQLMWRSFLQGLFIALGTTIGLSLLIGLVTFFLSQLRVVPVIKDLIEQTHIEKVLPSPGP